MVLLRHDLPAGSFASSTGGSRMLLAFFQRSALHLLLYDMTAQIVPPCSTLPLSAALFGCFPSPQMQGAEGCSLSFQKIAGSTTRHPEEASAFPDILQHTNTAPASCFGNRGGSFALWFFICAFQALARSLAGIFDGSLSGSQNYRAFWNHIYRLIFVSMASYHRT